MDSDISATTYITPPRLRTERREIDVPIPEQAEASASASGPEQRGRSYSVAEPIPRRRIGLLACVALGAVLIVGTGVYAISPRSPIQHRVPIVRTVTLVDPPTRVLVAPAAKLATMPTPAQTPVVWGTPAKADLGQDLTAVLQMGGHAAPTAVILDDQPPALLPNAPRRQALLFAARPQATVLPNASAAPLPPAPALLATAPAPKPAQPDRSNDPASQAAMLHLNPMTPPQQLDVLQLVTQLGSLVRDQRQELQRLRAAQQDLQDKVDTSVSDFARRLTLAEARGSIAAAMGGPSANAREPVEPVPSTAADRRAHRQPTSQDIVPLPMSIPSADTSIHRYAIQAASPGLAMLSELDPSGGEEQQVPISPGDNLPGYGRVVSIAQRGSGWYVKTDHGIIQ